MPTLDFQLPNTDRINRRKMFVIRLYNILGNIVPKVEIPIICISRGFPVFFYNQQTLFHVRIRLAICRTHFLSHRKLLFALRRIRPIDLLEEYWKPEVDHFVHIKKLLNHRDTVVNISNRREGDRVDPTQIEELIVQSEKWLHQQLKLL